MADVNLTTNAFLIVEGGVIKQVGTGEYAEVTDHRVDAAGGVVLPGFVDAHTHLVFGGDRSDELDLKCRGMSYQEIAKSGGGIKSTVAKTKACTEQQLLETGLKHLTWCLRNGTTTIEAKSGYGLDLETELNILLALHHVDAAFCESIGDAAGSRVIPTFLALHALPTDAPDRDKYVDHMVGEVLKVVAGAKLAKYVDAFVETGYFESIHAEKLATAARDLGLGLRLHVDQFADHDGAALAARLKADSADHLEFASEAGITALAGSATTPVLLPGAVFGLGLDKYPDARRMIDAGLPVALATDFNPGSSPTPSIPFVMALATRYLKMTRGECLAAVTVNAAHSLGLSDRGRLSPGQKADFSVWPISDWPEVLYWIDGPRPIQVWANGVRVN